MKYLTNDLIFLSRGPASGVRGWGGGFHVARLNFKQSRVGVHKCFTSLSEIEQKFFVFVGILERGIAMRCEETITVLDFLSEHLAYQTPIHRYSQLTQFTEGSTEQTEAH